MRKISDPFRRLLQQLQFVLMVVVGVLMIALATLLLLAPQTMSEIIGDLSPALRLVMLALIYAWAALWGYRQYQRFERPPVEGLVVAKSVGTLTSVSVDSAERAILDAVHKVDGVQGARADVRVGRRGRADIRLHVDIRSDEVNLLQKQRDIDRTLRHVVEKQLGVRFNEKPVVELNLAGTSSAPVAVPRPQPAASSAETPTPAPAAAERPTGLAGRLFGKKEEDAVSQRSPLQPARQTDKLATDEFFAFLEKTASDPPHTDRDAPAARSSQVDEASQPEPSAPEKVSSTEGDLPPVVAPPPISEPAAAPTKNNLDDDAEIETTDPDEPALGHPYYNAEDSDETRGEQR